MQEERAPSCDLFLVRHAERNDEAPDPAVSHIQRPGWDPPLTRRGHAQAADVARRLVAEHERQPFSCVFVSPTFRTVQTASHIGVALNIPLVCIPALSECAAAINNAGLSTFDPMQGMSKGAAASNPGAGKQQQRQKSSARFAAPAEVLAHSAAGARVEVLADSTLGDDYSLSFLEGVHALAAAHVGGRCLCVSHREGIRDIAQELCGIPKRLKTPYCCIAKFRYTQQNAPVDGGGAGVWELVELPS